jgi:hypothetical protein
MATRTFEVSGLTGDYAAWNGIYTGEVTGDFSGLLEQTSPGTGDIFGDDVYVWALTEHGSAIPYYMCESPPPESGEWTGWYTMAGADPAPTVTAYEEGASPSPMAGRRRTGGTGGSLVVTPASTLKRSGKGGLKRWQK